VAVAAAAVAATVVVCYN